MEFANLVPLVEATRGPIVESIMCGAAAIVDAQNRLVASLGDPDTFTYPRSTAKPLQVLPFVERGGLEHFGITPRELALMCASHAGTDDHAAVAESIQRKVGVKESDLLCGMHPPYDKDTLYRMIRTGEESRPNRHNCSGKHSGMLAHARLRGWSIEDYINPEHPLQKTIIQTFAEMTSFPAEKLAIGVDGCSAPVFALPLRNFALGFARLCDPAGLAPERAAACQKITQAMMSHPDMVSGPGRFDTRLMEVCQGKLIAKGGAEGYQGVGLLPGALGPGSPALGIAFKAADGDLGDRVRPLVTIELLRQLGVLGPAEIEALAGFATRPLYNWRKLPIGELRPVFKIQAG